MSVHFQKNGHAHDSIGTSKRTRHGKRAGKEKRMGIFTVVAEAAGTGLDTGIVTQLMDLVKTVMGLFSVFPLNILLVGSIIGIPFAIFRKAKGAAGGGT